MECYIERLTDKTCIGKTIIDGKRNSNAGAIALDDFIVAIDPSSTAKSAPIFREGIEKHFNSSTKYLFVTHYHGDHTLGIEAFHDTIIVGSKQLYDQMNKSGKHSIELSFSNKLNIENGDSRLELHYAGGHTDCSAIAYFPEEKVIFLGDLLFADEFPWAGDLSCNPDQWISFFEKILKLEYDYVVPGHGSLCGKEEVKKQLSLLKELRDNTILAVENNTGSNNIKKSKIYEKVDESRETRTLKHFYDFYSKHVRII